MNTLHCTGVSGLQDNVLVGAAPYALSPSVPVLPQQLARRGYSAHMVGKWHLGHSQPRQGPVGRGFESYTGSYMWDIESYTKLMYRTPWNPPYGADWTQVGHSSRAPR